MGQTLLQHPLHNFRMRKKCAKFHPHPPFSNPGRNSWSQSTKGQVRLLLRPAGSCSPQSSGLGVCCDCRGQSKEMRPKEGQFQTVPLLQPLFSLSRESIRPIHDSAFIVAENKVHEWAMQEVIMWLNSDNMIKLSLFLGEILAWRQTWKKYTCLIHLTLENVLGSLCLISTQSFNAWSRGYSLFKHLERCDLEWWIAHSVWDLALILKSILNLTSLGKGSSAGWSTGLLWGDTSVCN